MLVICEPQKLQILYESLEKSIPESLKEMKNAPDHYTNTYHIFTKDPDKLEEVLRCLQAMKWEQVFQIQGCQESLDTAIREVSALKLVQVDYRKMTLCVTKLPMKHKTSSDDEMEPSKSFKMCKLDENNRCDFAFCFPNF